MVATRSGRGRTGGVVVAEWAERIPAAIAKAERLVKRTSCHTGFVDGSATHVNPGEVALAGALWDSGCGGHGCPEFPDDNPALRAFVEKVEALGG